MRVISEKRFLVTLMRPGHYSLSLPEGVLVELIWCYSYGASGLKYLTEEKAKEVRRLGGKPWSIDDKKTPWAIQFVQGHYFSAHIHLYHYGQKVQGYATTPKQGESYLSDLKTEQGCELAVGEKTVRLSAGKSVMTKIKGAVVGDYEHPKHIIVQLLNN